MNAGIRWACSLDLSDATLSAWRDGALTADEAQRVAVHITTCAACRARLDAFEVLAALLRSERAPAPDSAQLWRNISPHVATIGNGGDRHSDGRPRNRPPRRAWGALAAVAAVVLLALGFAQLFGHSIARTTGSQPTATAARNTTPSGTPSGTPPATGVLTWRKAVFPPGPQGNWLPSNEDTQPSIDPNNGNIAYLCDSTSNPQDPEQVWRTRNFGESDQAAQWTRLADLPIERSAMNTCDIVPDTTDNATLLAIVQPTASSGTLGPNPLDFASFDGGATWQQVPATSAGQSLLFNGPPATYQGKIYALIGTIPDQPNQATQYQLATSGDQMRTWQTVKDQVAAFWLNPANGALLVEEANNDQIVTSLDGGLHWTPHATMGMADQFAVQAPAAGTPWFFCGRYEPSGASAGTAPVHVLFCTHVSQSAQTATQEWQMVPPPLPGVAPAIVYSGGQERLVGITSDGSVLATLLAQSGGGATSSESYRLFRLPPGATSWENLGMLPQYGVLYAPGVLIATPDSSVILRGCASCLADENDYVATYP